MLCNWRPMTNIKFSDSFFVTLKKHFAAYKCMQIVHSCKHNTAEAKSTSSNIYSARHNIFMYEHILRNLGMTFTLLSSLCEFCV